MTGNQIREIRERFGFDTVELAGFLGVAPSSVYRWEAQGRKPVSLGGLTAKIFILMGEVSAKDGALVVAAFRKEDCIGGLYKLLRLSYKKR